MDIIRNEFNNNELENSKAEINTITIDQFKSALENDLECKGYFDSLCDKTVNTRLNKSIETWKTNNLENLINDEINKRYPRKSEAELKLEQQQLQIEQIEQEKRQLQLQLQYQTLMAENNLPLDILDFVTGKDLESTINNIERFKNLTSDYISKSVQEEVDNRLKHNCYIPPINSDSGTTVSSMWK